MKNKYPIRVRITHRFADNQIGQDDFTFRKSQKKNHQGINYQDNTDHVSPHILCWYDSYEHDCWLAVPVKSNLEVKSTYVIMHPDEPKINPIKQGFLFEEAGEIIHQSKIMAAELKVQSILWKGDDRIPSEVLIDINITIKHLNWLHKNGGRRVLTDLSLEHIFRASELLRNVEILFYKKGFTRKTHRLISNVIGRLQNLSEKIA